MAILMLTFSLPTDTDSIKVGSIWYTESIRHTKVHKTVKIVHYARGLSLVTVIFTMAFYVENFGCQERDDGAHQLKLDKTNKK